VPRCCAVAAPAVARPAVALAVRRRCGGWGSGRTERGRLGRGARTRKHRAKRGAQRGSQPTSEPAGFQTESGLDKTRDIFCIHPVQTESTEFKSNTQISNFIDRVRNVSVSYRRYLDARTEAVRQRTVDSLNETGEYSAPHLRTPKAPSFSRPLARISLSPVAIEPAEAERENSAPFEFPPHTDTHQPDEPPTPTSRTNHRHPPAGRISGTTWFVSLPEPPGCRTNHKEAFFRSPSRAPRRGGRR